MTNYRIETNKNEKSMFTHCFSCGSKLISIKKELDNIDQDDYEDILACGQDKCHLKIWVYNDEDVETQIL